MKPAAVWGIGTSITHGTGMTGVQSGTGTRGATGPQPGRTYEWRFIPPKPGRYEHQLTGKRRFCVRVIVMQWGEAVPALATRIHRNTREFEWQEMDRKHRMAPLPSGRQGTCKVSDEGTVWCRGWKFEDWKALQAASALADT